MFPSNFKACLVVAACVTASCFATNASATLWNISSVDTGSDGGFSYSMLHKASPSNPMSGATVADIIDTGSFGQYDDSTGELTATFTLAGTGIDAGSTMSLVTQILDPLVFNGPDATLGATALIDVVFNVNFTGAAIPELVGSTIFSFAGGYVCCGSNGDDPNSFHDDGFGGKIMTLWGGDDVNGANPVGIDLRITLAPSEVPEPMSGALFGIGLAGFAYARRRKQGSAIPA